MNIWLRISIKFPLLGIVGALFGLQHNQNMRSNLRFQRRCLIPLLLAFVPALPAAAWGPVGHEVIAFIAQDNLTPKTKSKIMELAYPMDVRLMNRSYPDLASMSNWADQIRPSRPETAPWHFIDLPIRKDITKTDEANYCPDNNCVVNQLQIFEDILSEYSNGNYSKPKADRLEALKFIVHFVGDLHQPLHCADDGDRGGNDKLVRFKDPGRPGRGSRIKLHALWDGLIETHTDEDPRALASRLEKDLNDKKWVIWCKGNENDWALESYQIAKTKIYPGMDPGAQDYTDKPLPNDYYSKMRPIVDEQLEKAGIRLAFVLEEVLK